MPVATGESGTGVSLARCSDRTRTSPGSYARLPAIRVAVAAMPADADERGLAEVGVPRLGAGLGGLDFVDVRAALADGHRGHHRQRGAQEPVPVHRAGQRRPHPVEITSKRGSAVLMSRADFDALQETAYLPRVPANARRLLDSLEQARSGRREEHDLPASWGWSSPRTAGTTTATATGSRPTGDPETDQPADRRRAPRPVLRHRQARAAQARAGGGVGPTDTDEHRLVYLVDDNDLVVLPARFHDE